MLYNKILATNGFGWTTDAYRSVWFGKEVLILPTII